MHLRRATVWILAALTLCVMATMAGAQTLPRHAAKAAASRDSSAATVAAPPLRLRLTARVMAPGALRGLVQVTPHADNRMLRVVVDSENFYRSSEIQLEGERSPRSHFITWPKLPPGDYNVIVTVIDANGRSRQLSQSLLVTGMP